jgi:6-phospho-beta-glucosidase
MFDGQNLVFPEPRLWEAKLPEVFLYFYYDIFTQGEYHSYIKSVLEKKGIMPVFEAGDEELLKENTVD